MCKAILLYTKERDMQKDFYYIELFEIYKGLLTDKQREMFFSHYFLDLSYAEIAETEGNNRQSVYDAIKKVKVKLDEYESELKLKEKFDSIKKVCEQDGSDLKDKILDIVGK